MIENADIFVTGGAGTLGRAIARRRKTEGWTGKLTVYSSDEHKHAYMRRFYPDVNYVCGDIRNPDTLYNAMVGHDVVIHAAAVKVIPVSEYDSVDTFDVNVLGSQIVCATAIRAQVKHALFISTDKACHPANAYGASKMMMEKIVQEYARTDLGTQFHLVRYGNVLESTGSVVEAWHNAVKRGEAIKMTDPDMTRFWLSPNEAVNYVEDAFKFAPGLIYVPKMKALSIQKMAEYTVLYSGSKAVPNDVQIERIPLRPGEKMHETLVTEEETHYALDGAGFYLIRPTTGQRTDSVCEPFTSNVAEELTQGELLNMLAEEQ